MLLEASVMLTSADNDVARTGNESEGKRKGARWRYTRTLERPEVFKHSVNAFDCALLYFCLGR